MSRLQKLLDASTKTGKYVTKKQIFNNLAPPSCSSLVLSGEISLLLLLVSFNEDTMVGYYSESKFPSSEFLRK